MDSGEVRGSTLLSLKNPMSLMQNCTVRVARTQIPLRLTLRGFVYSPTRRRKKKAMRIRSAMHCFFGSDDDLASL